jgi:FAD/FMN-containing dehydrogenase
MPDLQVKTRTGKDIILQEKTIKHFQESLRGPLIRPGDAAYDVARTVYNALIDRHPALIARCADVADVITAVRFACGNDLRVSMRSGGHNGPGFAVCDGGLVIDLSRMRGMRVNPTARTVRVEGGCTWGDVDHATHTFSLATVSGIISTTGVGGLTLGGGHGHLTRKYGLTIDNLLAVDMVLADGRFVTANADEHTDLFWAARGGGGNFGVVTSFLFRLHPVDMVYAGPIFWSLDHATEVLQGYQEFITAAPEEMNAFFAFLKVPSAPPFPETLHGQTVCGTVCCYAGPLLQAEKVVQPLRACAPPLFEHLGPMPYPMLQSAFDAFYPPGLQWYWKGDFVNQLNEEAIALHVQYGTHLPTRHSTMHLYPINGAPHRVGKHDTAFSYRDATWSEVIVGVDPDPVNHDRIMTWTRDYWEALHPYSAGGAYVNFMMDEGMGHVQATYRGNYERLVQIKRRYDPATLFRVNQNIQPAV